jgi:7-cyano-7-deazaguanine synthase in queuosine biosynthesis
MSVEKYFVHRSPVSQEKFNIDATFSDRTDYEKTLTLLDYESNRTRENKPPYVDSDVEYDINRLTSLFPSEIPAVVLDFVEIGVATYAIDKLVSREINIVGDDDRDRLDTRNIKIQIPVLDSRFSTERVEQLYSQMVSHLTRDVIEYDFIHTGSTQRETQGARDKDLDVISLLSDGIDSAGGIYYNQRRADDVQYLTVEYSGVTSTTEKHADIAGVADHSIQRVKSPSNREQTQFSRGLLHLSFAVAAAIRGGASHIRSFENGIMDQFLVLSDGWQTTRTVSPFFLLVFNNILSEILNQEIVVENPFQNLTKTEVVNLIEDTDLVRSTVSCPHSNFFSASNCGLCVPCLLRTTSIIKSNHDIDYCELNQHQILLEGDYEELSYSKTVGKPRNESACTPEVFFRAILEVAYFSRRIKQESPRGLSVEYPELLSEDTYKLHSRFSSEFLGALRTVSRTNPSITRLLPE